MSETSQPILTYGNLKMWLEFYRVYIINNDISSILSGEYSVRLEMPH
jgi:hypothetical protein